MPRSMVQRRLSQAHRSRCIAATNTIVSSQFALLQLVFSTEVDLFCLFPPRGRLVPWSYSRRRRRGRFADNRSPPTSRWASCGDHGSRLTRPTTLVGTKVASDPRQRLPKRKGTPLGLFFEPESAGAIALRFMRRHSQWRRDWTAIEWAGRRCCTLPRESTCAKRWS